VKLVRLAGVNGLDQFKIFIFDFFVFRVLFRCHICLSPDKNLSVRWIFPVSAGCRPGAKTRRRQSPARLLDLSSVISSEAASQPDQVSRQGGIIEHDLRLWRHLAEFIRGYRTVVHCFLATRQYRLINKNAMTSPR